MAGPDIVVLRMGTHGLSAGAYADAIRERLPDYDVALARTPHEERELVREAPIVTGVTMDEEALANAENLKLFACSFAGYEHLPWREMKAQGVTVTNAGGIHAPNIAEQVIGHILVFTRRIDEALRRKRNHEWRHFQAREFMGSTVTVVGLGAIGTAVVERLAGFGVETIGVRYTPEKGGPTDEVIGFDDADFHDALARSEYVVLACPLSETTRGLIGEEELITMHPEAVLINVARGEVVQTDALIEEIKRQGIRGAALDVTDPEPLPADHELWTLENVHITPHNGGHTPRHWDRLVDILEENVRRIEDTGSYTGLRNEVVTPDD